MRGTRTLLITVLLSAVLVACRGGQESDQSSDGRASTATAPATAATSSPTQAGATPPIITSTPPPTVVTVTPGTPGAAPTATATPTAGSKTVLAPVVDARIEILQSQPPAYVLRVTTALPNGCSQFKDALAQRDGTQITVTVENEVPASERVACTQVYGTKQTTIDLGRDFTRGTTYTVIINGERTLTFVGQ